MTIRLRIIASSVPKGHYSPEDIYTRVTSFSNNLRKYHIIIYVLAHYRTPDRDLEVS